MIFLEIEKLNIIFKCARVGFMKTDKIFVSLFLSVGSLASLKGC